MTEETQKLYSTAVSMARRLAGILDESRLPDHLFSWRGIKRIILG